jgi:DNA polymerase-3 subunit epsilon
MRLREPIIVLDCQTTGANPSKGHLLEIAWCSLSTAEVTSHLVCLPTGASLPGAITRLTGIRPADLSWAAAPAAVWSSLRRSLGPTPTPTLIHFARFERPFLEKLHHEHGDGPFPLDIICTHEIARRLLPDLPRRSLRALAGYFGHLKPELKRAASHVAATLQIWDGLSALLAEQAPQVQTFDDLGRWLQEPAPRSSRRRYPMSRDRRLRLADAPGVYHFRNRRGELLYVGKATSLRRRVNSYFQKQRRIPERTLELLTQVADVEVATTESTLEAALLEAETIRRLTPPYNKALNRQLPVWFATRDLRDARTSPDPAHRVGPVPSRETLTAVASLADWLAGAREGGSPAAVLAIPAGRAPDRAVFSEGIAQFVRLHGSCVLDLPGLLRLGNRLWRDDKRAATEDKNLGRRAGPARKDIAPDSNESSGGRVSWTPEAVAAALDAMVLRAAHLVRRAHWLQELCSCNLHWRSAGETPRVLVVREARVVDRFVDDGRRLALPPTAALDRRLGWLDSTAHDRLRVLGTELKRLAARESQLTLQLARVRLDRRGLARRLWWI